MKTKERILLGALDLFNTHAASEVTTNDIARDLKMSPGNLYFHYKNKEQIIRELFKRLAAETTEIWQPQTKLAKKNQQMQLIDFIDKNLELYWKYRFFHRELYTLRKKDPELSKLWRAHLKKLGRHMIILHKHWVRSGYMEPIKSKNELEFVGELLFVASNSFMQFFETVDRAPNQRTVEKAKRHIMRMLTPYLSGEIRATFEKYIQ
ncbi:TetR/AcrR family transcriptional regulator [Pseudobdellovibrio exovorus]|uniref:TetR family transcriptional regulator n=1 Tax=Pseudobdellovibrio exovorus JSS TaxID=1184267 RepID=M4VAM9_9BACT|nr:TetR/AcrR family transcriptional regulator [Pseudobdellovibrio exovorus]AGH96457.1 TetR family transcriptional regulator [Pseudobdellovibrio exovorus JSS]